MGLNTYGKINYEVIVPMSIDYSMEVVHPSGGRYGSTAQYKYMRHVKKTYRFKGMNEATTKSCLAAKKEQYNRKFLGWTLQGNNYHPPSYYDKWGASYLKQPDYYEQVASFNVIRNGDAPLYDVEITVDEVVCVYLDYLYDLHTAAGRQALETRMARNESSLRISYIYEYSYDENLT